MEPENNQANKTNPVTTIAAAIVTGAAMIAIVLLLVLHPSTSNTTTPTPSTNTGPTNPTSIPADIATIRPSDENHIRGDASTAQVLIFEYSDSDCPFCQQFHPTLQQVVKDYNGKVAWVYRFFPLTIHPDAHNEAVALQCVSEIGGAKAFNSYLDTLINITLTANAQAMPTLGTFAQQQGVDSNKFGACTSDPATSAFVDNSIKEAVSIGAQGTPFSVIVNVKTGQQIIVPGAYPLAQVEADINSLLK